MYFRCKRFGQDCVVNFSTGKQSLYSPTAEIIGSCRSLGNAYGNGASLSPKNWRSVMTSGDLSSHAWVPWCTCDAVDLKG